MQPTTQQQILITERIRAAEDKGHRMNPTRLAANNNGEYMTCANPECIDIIAYDSLGKLRGDSYFRLCPHRPYGLFRKIREG